MAEWASIANYDADDAGFLACDQIGEQNFNWYCNKQLDNLFVKEQSTADPNERQQIFNQIHQVLLTDFPMATMFSPNDLSIAKLGTHNYKPGPFGGSETVNIQNWWCDNGKCPSGGGQ